MTVSTETVRMAKSRPRKNQSERSDLSCHIIKRIINTMDTFPTTLGFPNSIPAADVQLSIQTQVMSARTHLNYTTCLYLSPIIKARSLSTLIALEDNMDTAAKTIIKVSNDN